MTIELNHMIDRARFCSRIFGVPNDPSGGYFAPVRVKTGSRWILRKITRPTSNSTSITTLSHNFRDPSGHLLELLMRT